MPGTGGVTVGDRPAVAHQPFGGIRRRPGGSIFQSRFHWPNWLPVFPARCWRPISRTPSSAERSRADALTRGERRTIQREGGTTVRSLRDEHDLGSVSGSLGVVQRSEVAFSPLSKAPVSRVLRSQGTISSGFSRCRTGSFDPKEAFAVGRHVVASYGWEGPMAGPNSV